MPKITKEQEKAVTDWFMNSFWPAYPAKYCRGGKGSRAMTLTSMLKVNPDEEMRDRIFKNLVAQIRAAAKNPDRKWWVIGTTYVNNRMWEDEIESQMEIEEKQSLKKCCVDGCSDDVHGPAYRYCCLHLPGSGVLYKKLIEAKKIVDKEIDRSAPDYAKRCSEYARSKGFII